MGQLSASIEVDGVPQASPVAGENPCTLAAVPLFHVTGSHAVFLLSLVTARKIVFMYKWDAKAALSLIEKHKVSDMTGVPTMSWEILQAHKENPEVDIYNCHHLLLPHHYHLDITDSSMHLNLYNPNMIIHHHYIHRIGLYCL